MRALCNFLHEKEECLSFLLHQYEHYKKRKQNQRHWYQIHYWYMYMIAFCSQLYVVLLIKAIFISFYFSERHSTQLCATCLEETVL